MSIQFGTRAQINYAITLRNAALERDGRPEQDPVFNATESVRRYAVAAFNLRASTLRSVRTKPCYRFVADLAEVPSGPSASDVVVERVTARRAELLVLIDQQIAEMDRDALSMVIDDLKEFG